MGRGLKSIFVCIYLASNGNVIDVGVLSSCCVLDIFWLPVVGNIGPLSAVWTYSDR